MYFTYINVLKKNAEEASEIQSESIRDGPQPADFLAAMEGFVSATSDLLLSLMITRWMPWLLMHLVELSMY